MKKMKPKKEYLLLNCPFCGSEPQYIRNGGLKGVACSNPSCTAFNIQAFYCRWWKAVRGWNRCGGLENPDIDVLSKRMPLGGNISDYLEQYQLLEDKVKYEESESYEENESLIVGRKFHRAMMRTYGYDEEMGVYGADF